VGRSKAKVYTRRQAGTTRTKGRIERMSDASSRTIRHSRVSPERKRMQMQNVSAMRRNVVEEEEEEEEEEVGSR
jgi:hypothetical protein